MARTHLLVLRALLVPRASRICSLSLSLLATYSRNERKCYDYSSGSSATRDRLHAETIDRRVSSKIQFESRMEAAGDREVSSGDFASDRVSHGVAGGIPRFLDRASASRSETHARAETSAELLSPRHAFTNGLTYVRVLIENCPAKGGRRDENLHSRKIHRRPWGESSFPFPFSSV